MPRCPRCAGTGIDPDDTTVLDEGAPDKPAPLVCPVCDGNGEILGDQQALLEDGDSP